MLFKNMRFFALVSGLFFAMMSSANADSVNALLHNKSDPVAGNPKGKITVVEFFDYQCSHCMSMAPSIQTIIRTNPDVRVVFKDFAIRGPMSDFAARAALAANKQGKYYEFSHALLSTNLTLNEASIFEIAKTAGVNVDKMKKDMNSDEIKKQLQAVSDLARDLNIDGTPAFFIGKTDAKDSKNLNFVMGEMSVSEMQDAITTKMHT